MPFLCAKDEIEVYEHTGGHFKSPDILSSNIFHTHPMVRRGLKKKPNNRQRVLSEIRWSLWLLSIINEIYLQHFQYVGIQIDSITSLAILKLSHMHFCADHMNIKEWLRNFFSIPFQLNFRFLLRRNLEMFKFLKEKRPSSNCKSCVNQCIHASSVRMLISSCKTCDLTRGVISFAFSFYFSNFHHQTIFPSFLCPLEAISFSSYKSEVSLSW